MPAKACQCEIQDLTAALSPDGLFGQKEMPKADVQKPTVKQLHCSLFDLSKPLAYFLLMLVSGVINLSDFL